MASTWGRYLVLADITLYDAASFCVRAAPSCLLLVMASWRHESSVSTRCAFPVMGKSTNSTSVATCAIVFLSFLELLIVYCFV